MLPILDRLEQEGLCTVLRILPYIPEDRPFNAYEHGEILYKDSDHMSSKGSIKLFQHLKPQLKEALKKNPRHHQVYKSHSREHVCRSSGGETFK